MNQNLNEELRRIRSELERGSLTYDVDSLGKRLAVLSEKTAPTDFYSAILKIFVGYKGTHYVPSFVLEVVEKILKGRKAKTICDPWAGIGALLSTAQEATGAKEAFAFTESETAAGFGAIIAKSLKWYTGDPFDLLNKLKTLMSS